MMAGFYKAANKRLITRGTGGRFRRTTAADTGISTCGTCEAVFVPDYSSLGGGTIDPRAMRDLQSTCPKCRAENTQGKEVNG